MARLKGYAKKIPAFSFVYMALRNKYAQSKSMEDVFTKIYRSKAWGGEDSLSGPGSDVCQTRIISSELPALFINFNISTMLDIPCGDFNWMKNVDLNTIDYMGADIIKELVQKNIEKWARDGVCFQHLNLIKDKLPKVDLIFCRDCLVHFSFADIFLALNNVCNSQSEYFLTTTFTGRKNNHDILTGQWRVINLELSPFVLPKPLTIINEECKEADGAYEDKALGLWRIADVRESITRRCT